jgi:hypothetical protein
LNVIDHVGNVALLEHVLIFFKSKEGLAHAHLGEKVLGVKRTPGRFLQSNLLSPQAKPASGGSTTRSGTEMSRGRRDDVTKHARFMIGTLLNIAQFSTH